MPLIRRALVLISLVATLTLGAHAEWKVGVAIGLSQTLAAALPVAIDAYVLAALIAGRDVAVALTILALSIGGGHAYIGAQEDDPRRAVLGAVVGLILVAVLWRVEELAKAGSGRPIEEGTPRDSGGSLGVARTAPTIVGGPSVPALLPVEAVAVPEPPGPPVAVTANPTANATAKPPKKATAKKTADGGPTANATASRDGSPAQKVAWLVEEMSGGRSTKELRLESGWSDRTWDRHLKAANDALAELAASDKREAVG